MLQNKNLIMAGPYEQSPIVTKCYGFMVRQLTNHKTSYGQSILRTMETIHNISISGLWRKNQSKKGGL